MKRKAGQSLVEACIIMMLLCLIFFGLLQVSQLSVSREVLDYAASCGVRARTVGFNDFMCGKVIRVAAIPNAGQMLEPQVVRQPNPPAFARTAGEAWDTALRAQPASLQYAAESARIPLYLGADHPGRLPGILDYEYWGNGTAGGRVWHWINDSAGPQVEVRTGQDVPLWVPLHRLFINADSYPLQGEAAIENHYPLYLDNGSG